MRNSSKPSIQTKLSLRSILSTEGIVVGRSHGSAIVDTSVLLLNSGGFLSGNNSVDDHSEGDGEEEPVNDSKGKSSVDGVAFTSMRVSAGGSNALCVLSDVDREGDPDGEEHAPVYEFKGEGNVLVRERTVDHSRGHDPDEREESPGTLKPIVSIIFVEMRDHLMGELTAATVNRTSFQPVILSRVYAERDMTKMAKIN